MPPFGTSALKPDHEYNNRFNVNNGIIVINNIIWKFFNFIFITSNLIMVFTCDDFLTSIIFLFNPFRSKLGHSVELSLAFVNFR